LSKETGCRFESVPNCNPKSEVVQLTQTKNDTIAFTTIKPKVRFLFQGLLSPGRGLEEIIRAWLHVSDIAQLVLRGPECEFKDRLVTLATDLEMGSESVMFMPAVREDELVTAATEFDVGLIPYPPSNTNNAHCCPNKMSQYMAAGLPILANHTSFVSQVITEAKCGVVVDFGRTDLLIEKIRWIASHDIERNAMAANSKAYFRDKFNWESVSLEMYRKILNLVSDQPVTPLTVWPTGHLWVYRSEVSSFDLSISAHLNNGLASIAGKLSHGQENITIKNGVFRYSSGVWRRLPVSLRERLQPLKKWMLRGLGR
jgi:glycosyltransferase involved in cell wall biosynthesis